MIHSNLRFFT